MSIINWVKEPKDLPSRFVLDGMEVEGITASLRPLGFDVSTARPISENRGLAFQGPIPAGDGFVLSAQEAEELVERPEADYRSVVRPYLIGEDVANDSAQAPTRWVIDFGSMGLEEAMQYPGALAVCANA